jgi:hypothetical protein
MSYFLIPDDGDRQHLHKQLGMEALAGGVLSCYFHGCCSHGQHLLVKNTCMATKTKKNIKEVAMYPTEYPFETMPLVINRCKDVVKFFHNHHVPKAQLQELQKITGAQGLLCPVLTQWGTIQQICQTLMGSKCHLHIVVTARDFMKGLYSQKAECRRVKVAFSNNCFVKDLKTALQILVPIDRLIVKYWSDKVPVSEVLPNILALPEEFQKLFAANLVTEDELNYLVMLTVKHIQFTSGVAHGLSYMLDPRHLGHILLTLSCHNLKNTLFESPEDKVTPSNASQHKLLYMEYTKFLIATSQQKNEKLLCYKALLKGSKIQ